MKLSLLVIIVGAVIFAALFLLVSLLVMVLANVVLNHYGVAPLDFGSSLALTGLSAILFGGSRVSNGKDQ